MAGNGGELLVWGAASWITKDDIVCNQKVK